MKQQMIMLLFMALIMGCKASKKEPDNQQAKSGEQEQHEQLATNHNQQQNPDKQKENLLPESYRQYPEKIKAENDRYVDSNNILHVDLLGKNIPVSEGKAMITEMFPDCNVSYNNASTDYFDVFNIDCQGKPYTAIVSYESNMENENVIAFLYIQDQPFSMKMIENLFED